MPYQEMPKIVINPGSQVVEPSSIENASANMSEFIIALHQRGLSHIVMRRNQEFQQAGRFAFELTKDGNTSIVLMPGAPPDQVIMKPGDDPWKFYRLYVDGASWLWEYALNAVFSALSASDEIADEIYDLDAALIDIDKQIKTLQALWREKRARRKLLYNKAFMIEHNYGAGDKVLITPAFTTYVREKAEEGGQNVFVTWEEGDSATLEWVNPILKSGVVVDRAGNHHWVNYDTLHKMRRAWVTLQTEQSAIK